MKYNPKNFSVKIIKGHAYIYSWSYRKISYRTSSISQRYYWKYRGRYGTRRVRDFMKRLTIEEQEQLKKEVERKLSVHKQIQNQVDELLKTEPFNSQYKEIIEIKNRINREQSLRKLHSQLNAIVRKNAGI
ncbi:hypothetical protein MMB68_10440 [Priestia sp. Y58]|uniref:hypothetical protein n=1 Tax=Priestia sp. Y58 TaxID=2922804 RepID=UPI0024073A95|nr:hypothetical protein [Priestia sp. Y58]MDG0029974.1 hypothetical protein [Priestia sp. Y58]